MPNREYEAYRSTIKEGDRALSRSAWTAQQGQIPVPVTRPNQGYPPAPAELPSAAPDTSFAFGEVLRDATKEVSKLNQQKQLDEQFKALGLDNMVGSKVDANFLGTITGNFKKAKDQGALNFYSQKTRQMEAENEAKAVATETAYKHFEDLGVVLADVEPSKLKSMIAGSSIDYPTALLYQKRAEYDKKLAETKNEEERVTLAKEMELMDLEIAQARKDLTGEETPSERAKRLATEAETEQTDLENLGLKKDLFGEQEIYDEPIVETSTKSVLGGNVKLKTTVATALETAMLDLDKKGVELKIADSYVPYGVKEAAYLSGKEGNVSGATSFHVKGQAVDLSQLSVDEMNNEVVFNALNRAGFQQHPTEWYHWSMGEFGGGGGGMTKEQKETLSDTIGDLDAQVASGVLKTRGDALAFIDTFKSKILLDVGQEGYNQIAKEVDKLFPPPPQEQQTFSGQATIGKQSSFSAPAQDVKASIGKPVGITAPQTEQSQPEATTSFFGDLFQST